MNNPPLTSLEWRLSDPLTRFGFGVVEQPGAETHGAEGVLQRFRRMFVERIEVFAHASSQQQRRLWDDRHGLAQSEETYIPGVNTVDTNPTGARVQESR